MRSMKFPRTIMYKARMSPLTSASQHDTRSPS